MDHAWFGRGVTLWVLASVGLRIYLHFFNSYSKSYGSLGAVIILLLWFYVTVAAILIGGEVNSEVERAAAGTGPGGLAKPHGEGAGPVCAWCGQRMGTGLAREMDDHVIDELEAMLLSDTHRLRQMLEFTRKLPSAVGSMHWTLVEFATSLIITSDHPLVLSRKPNASPLAVRRRAPAQIHHHVQNFSCNDPQQFPLRVLHLVVQAPKHVLSRKRMVILDETLADPDLHHGALVIGFQEEAAGIAEHLGFNHQNVGQWSVDDFHVRRVILENFLLQQLEQVSAITVPDGTSNLL